MGSFNTIQESGGGGGGWEQGVNQITLGTSGDLVGIGIAPTEKLHIDGVVSLKAQSSAASTTAGNAKIYSTDTGAPTDSNIKYLWHFEGADGTSATGADATGNHSWQIANNVELDTAQKRWGTSSCKFDGGDDDYFWDSGTSADYNLPGDFCIHFWFRFSALTTSGAAATNVFYTQNIGGIDSGTFRFLYSAHPTDETYGGFRFDHGGSMTTGLFGNRGHVSIDKWYWTAIIRTSNELRCYVTTEPTDTTAAQVGALLSTSATYDDSANNQGPVIGTNYGTENSFGPGWLDEFTYIKGSNGGFGVGSTVVVPTGPDYGTELNVLDEAGNATKISPHNPKTGAWEFYSKNQKTGKTVRINMEEVVSDLGKLTGKNYIKDE